MLAQILIGFFVLSVFLLAIFSVFTYFTGEKEPTIWRGKVIKYIAIGTVSIVVLTVAIAGAIITGTVLLNQIGY